MQQILHPFNKLSHQNPNFPLIQAVPKMKWQYNTLSLYSGMYSFVSIADQSNRQANQN
jgi:hypothetical protein